MDLEEDEGDDMKGHGRKILVVNSWWAGIFAALLVSLICSAFAMAFNANAAIAVLQDNVKNITDSKLDERLTRMEEKIDWIIKEPKRSR